MISFGFVLFSDVFCCLLLILIVDPRPKIGRGPRIEIKRKHSKTLHKYTKPYEIIRKPKIGRGPTIKINPNLAKTKEKKYKARGNQKNIQDRARADDKNQPRT